MNAQVGRMANFSLADSLTRLLGCEENIGGLDAAVSELAAILQDAGYAPNEMSVSVTSAHPSVAGRRFVWEKDRNKTRIISKPLNFLDGQEHLGSPIHYVMISGTTLFIDGAQIGNDQRFAFVKKIARQGATSYVAIPINLRQLGQNQGVFALWTKQARGWTLPEISMLQPLLPVLGMIARTDESNRLLGLVGVSEEVRARGQADATMNLLKQTTEAQQSELEELKTSAAQEKVLSALEAINISGWKLFSERAGPILAHGLGIDRVSFWLYGQSQITCISLYERSTQCQSAGIVIKAEDAPKYFYALKNKG